MRRHPLDTIEVLITSWILGGEGDRDRIPISHGVLDRALRVAMEHGAFPPWFAKNSTSWIPGSDCDAWSCPLC